MYKRYKIYPCVRLGVYARKESPGRRDSRLDDTSPHEEEERLEAVSFKCEINFLTFRLAWLCLFVDTVLPLEIGIEDTISRKNEMLLK